MSAVAAMLPFAAVACGAVGAPVASRRQLLAVDRRVPVAFGESRVAPARAASSPAERQRLDAVARLVRREPAVRIVVEGHTDGRGGDRANLRLGLRRAEWARDYVTVEGRACHRCVEILASAAVVE